MSYGRPTKTPSVPSDTQAHVLELASRQGTNIWYVPLVDGKGSQSRTVGRSLTIEACWRHGWLERGTANLTQAGRDAMGRYRARLERAQARYEAKVLAELQAKRDASAWNVGF